MLIWIILAATSTGIAVFVTLYKTSPLDVAYSFGCVSWWWVAGLLTIYYATRVIDRKGAPPTGWQTAPIRHYAFESKMNEGRTIQRTALELSAEDMYELRRIAELVIENGETFNARTIGPGYGKWRRWLMRRGWLAWKNRDSVTGGVVVTDKGYNEFRNILNPPSPDAEMSNFTGILPITHATEAQNDHQ